MVLARFVRIKTVVVYDYLADRLVGIGIIPIGKGVDSIWIVYYWINKVEVRNVIYVLENEATGNVLVDWIVRRKNRNAGQGIVILENVLAAKANKDIYVVSVLEIVADNAVIQGKVLHIVRIDLV